MADLCRCFEPGPIALSLLVAAGFVLLDAGPANLALVDDDSVVFLNWEHISKGEAKRKDINDQVKRVVASAASHMAPSLRWCRAANALKGLVFDSWWLTMADQ